METNFGGSAFWETSICNLNYVLRNSRCRILALRDAYISVTASSWRTTKKFDSKSWQQPEKKITLIEIEELPCIKSFLRLLCSKLALVIWFWSARNFGFVWLGEEAEIEKYLCVCEWILKLQDVMKRKVKKKKKKNRWAEQFMAVLIFWFVFVGGSMRLVEMKNREQ